ncbi:uncharacterized protein [Gossypium hirsutum]|uniref:Integrase zinc-binding domain-containing protein n=1 Tax=Gossypium hirsutum TaxID=3635 RepID=A0ABM2YHX2_GOSHI|nr:uncharacterized protein LOC121203756 [Gossypium hirsutum]
MTKECVRNLQFSRIAGYYRHFVKGFLMIAASLTKLLHKRVPFIWTDVQQESFMKFKTVLTQAPILIQPEPGRDFVLKTHEANYPMHDLELVAVVFELNIWRHYLYEYHPGKAKVVADALSRRAVADLRTLFARLNLFDDGNLLAELQVKTGTTPDVGINSDGVLCFREAHSSPYAMHPDRNKMYRDLRELYWWLGLKRKVTDYVARCLFCQQVKAERQLPSGFL